MRVRAQDGTRRVRALALKLAAWLVLSGVFLAASVAFCISRFAMRLNTSHRIALPGRLKEVTIGIMPVAVLAAASLTVIAFAATFSILRKTPASGDGPSSEFEAMTSQASRPKRRGFYILAFSTLFLAGVLGLRWFQSTSKDLSVVGGQGTSRP